MSAQSGDGRRPGHPSFTRSRLGLIDAARDGGDRRTGDRARADWHDPNLRHALGRTAERAGRVLRGVYNGTVLRWRVMTVYFDRTQRHKL